MVYGTCFKECVLDNKKQPALCFLCVYRTPCQTRESHLQVDADSMRPLLAVATNSLQEKKGERVEYGKNYFHDNHLIFRRFRGKTEKESNTGGIKRTKAAIANINHLRSSSFFGVVGKLSPFRGLNALVLTGQSPVVSGRTPFVTSFRRQSSRYANDSPSL